jgi:hypothetical protein
LATTGIEARVGQGELLCAAAAEPGGWDPSGRDLDHGVGHVDARDGRAAGRRGRGHETRSRSHVEQLGAGRGADRVEQRLDRERGEGLEAVGVLGRALLPHRALEVVERVELAHGAAFTL